MRNRKSNGLPVLHGEELAHPEWCGCGCWLTPQQWQAEDDNDQGLRLVEFDGGSYTTESPNPCMFCWGDDCGGGCYG